MSQDECLWLANEWKSGKDHQTGLITGTQWDRMVSWICDAGDNGPFDDGVQSIDDSTKPGKLYDCKGWGNYKDSLSTTYKSIFTSGVPVGSNGELWGQWIERPKNWSRNGTGDDYRFVFPTGKFISSDGIDTSKKNVYDVAGNVCEWTTEISPFTGTAPNYTSRVLRGGSANDPGCDDPVTCRNGHPSSTTYANWLVGFRVVLYAITPE